MHCRIEKLMWENHIFISCAKIVTIPAYSRAKMNTNVFLILYPFLWYQIWLHVFAPFWVRTNFPTSCSPFYLLKSLILSESALCAYPRYIRYAGRHMCIKREKNGRERRREGKTAKGKDRCHRVTLDTGQWPLNCSDDKQNTMYIYGARIHPCTLYIHVLFCQPQYELSFRSLLLRRFQLLN